MRWIDLTNISSFLDLGARTHEDTAQRVETTPVIVGGFRCALHLGDVEHKRTVGSQALTPMAHLSSIWAFVEDLDAVALGGGRSR